MSWIQRGLIGIGALLLASCGTTPSLAAPTSPAVAVDEAEAVKKAINANSNCSRFLGGVVCPTTSNFTLRPGADISEYYAFVEADTNTQFSVKNKDNWIVSKLKKLIGSEKNYTARIDLELRQKVGNQELPLGTYSLLAFKVVDGSVTDEKAGSVTALKNAMITNAMSLRAGDQVLAVIRFTSTEDTNVNLTAFLNNVTPLANAVGGGLASVVGGGVTKATAPVLDSLLSDKQLQTVEYRSVLGARDGQAKSLEFIAPAAPGASASDFKLTLRLVPQASLLLKSAKAEAPLRWSNAIINPEGQITLASGDTLSKFLTDRGIPARAFSIVPSADAKTRVAQACSDLSDALTRVDYVPLNQFDSETIIRARLNAAADGLDTNLMSTTCIADRMQPDGVWSRYGIPPVNGQDIVTVSYVEAEAYFKALNKAMLPAEATTRRIVLDGLTDTDRFELRAPTTMFKGSENDWASVNDDDVGRAAGTLILSRARSCALGSFVPSGDSTNGSQWSFLILPENSAEIWQGTATFSRNNLGSLVLARLAFRSRPANHKLEGTLFAKDADVQAIVAGGKGGACT